MGKKRIVRLAGSVDLCRLQAAHWTKLRQLGSMGKPTKQCVWVCCAVQFFYPTTMRCQKSEALANTFHELPNVYANVGPFVQFLNIIETTPTLSSIFFKNFL
jgi:hypothetical protein